MSTAPQSTITLTLEDVQAILAQWKAEGSPTPEEQDQFMENAIRDLNDPEKAQGYQANIEKVGIWANEVDASFDSVKRSLDDMVRRYEHQFPELAGFRDQWVVFNSRWVANLLLSRDVASQQIAILKRYDQVFLDMIQHIVTDQDREDVIAELQQFIDEDYSDPEKMSQGFYALQKDVGVFLDKFSEYVKDKGTELAARAKELRKTIEGLQSTIVGLVVDISVAILALAAALAGAATIVGLLGVAAASASLLVLYARLFQADLDLLRAREELAQVNATQQALAHLETEFEGLKPDIDLICNRLGLFGDIWQGIRSDSTRFQTHLKRGMGALDDERFQLEVRFARSTCLPMQAGLEKYAAALDNRQQRSQDAEKMAYLEGCA